MPKRGGNVLRKTENRLASRVPDDPRTMLNLLKTLPGVFGELPNEQVESMDPAIIFTDGDKYGCYFDPAEVSLTRSFAHRVLAEASDREPNSVIRAYLVNVPEGRFLFPSAHDLSTADKLEGETFEERFTELKQSFVGRAAVTLGGISHDGRSADLVPIAMATQELLAASHRKGIDYMVTQQNLSEVVEAVLVDGPQE